MPICTAGTKSSRGGSILPVFSRHNIVQSPAMMRTASLEPMRLARNSFCSSDNAICRSLSCCRFAPASPLYGHSFPHVNCDFALNQEQNGNCSENPTATRKSGFASLQHRFDAKRADYEDGDTDHRGALGEHRAAAGIGADRHKLRMVVAVGADRHSIDGDDHVALAGRHLIDWFDHDLVTRQQPAGIHVQGIDLEREGACGGRLVQQDTGAASTQCGAHVILRGTPGQRHHFADLIVVEHGHTAGCRYWAVAGKKARLRPRGEGKLADRLGTGHAGGIRILQKSREVGGGDFSPLSPCGSRPTALVHDGSEPAVEGQSYLLHRPEPRSAKAGGTMMASMQVRKDRQQICKRSVDIPVKSQTTPLFLGNKTNITGTW